MLRAFHAVAAALVMAGRVAAAAAAGPAEPACAAGLWIDPESGAVLEHDRVIASAAAQPVVLLGETHDNVEHHRWQLSTIAGLLARRPDLVLGFEVFPRRVGSALERWVKGELNPDALLEAVDWERIWGYDPDLYLPLFHLARQHRIPVVALNVDREDVAAIAEEGAGALPEDIRREIGEPVAPSEAYLEVLLEAYAEHVRRSDEAGDEMELEELREGPQFQRFVEAQLTWDRAMAEALAQAHARPTAPLVVGMIGSGHLRFGHGVPRQLEDLGIENVAVLLPYDIPNGCEGLEPAVADAVFTLASPRDRPEPRPVLGVSIEPDEKGVRIERVMPGSVAAAAGLQQGDLITRAAGFDIASPADLVEIVRRQASGTWLPLQIDRSGGTRDVVAKFPREFAPEP
jgi:uncharacterized iron-regulated protein